MARYGPNSRQVETFIECLRKLDANDGAALRRAYLATAAQEGLGGPAAGHRAAVTLEMIRAAVRHRRKLAHRAAMAAGLQADGSSGAREAGIGVFLGDLAGAISVRDVIAEDAFEYLASGWRSVRGGACLDPSPSRGSPVAIRRAGSNDAQAVADLWLASFKATYPFPPAHPDDEVGRWVRDEVVTREETFVAVEPDGSVVGVMSLTGDEIDQLYVRPERVDQGIGSRFVELAKERRPGGLALYTFQVNERARRFYERHGFAVDRFGTGDGNEERQPDVRYVWRPERGRVPARPRRPTNRSPRGLSGGSGPA